VNKDQFVYLMAGVAFGLLVGFAIYAKWFAGPVGEPEAGPAPAPAGPSAPSQGGRGPFMEQFEQLKQRLDANPNDVVSLVAMGDLLYGGGAWHEAAHVYERALEIRPNDADLLTVTARCYAESGDGEKALGLLERAIAVDPTHYAALYNTAMIQGLSLGRFDEAEETLEVLDAEYPGAAEVTELREALAGARGAAVPN
jgi:cytochrome c-type biogenesis protein CcmH/NrfG